MEGKINDNDLKKFYEEFATKYNDHPDFPLGLWCEIVKEFGTFDVMGQGHTDESFFIKHKLGICDENTYRQHLNILPFDKLNPKQMENVVKLYNAYSRSIQNEYVLLENNGIISYNPKTMNSFMIVDRYGNGKCYYKDGWVNPVKNRKTFPNEGINVGKNDFNKIKEAVKKNNFKFINEHYCQSNLGQLPHTNMQTVNSKKKNEEGCCVIY